MKETSTLINHLRENFEVRASYTEASVSVNVPSQIRALRLKRGMNQAELAKTAHMRHQSAISRIERPGDLLSLNTLVKLAAAFKVGLMVKFVPFSEMLKWNDDYCQDLFDVTPIDADTAFLAPERAELPISANIAFPEASGNANTSLSPSYATSQTQPLIPYQTPSDMFRLGQQLGQK